MNNYQFSLDDFQKDYTNYLLGNGKFGYVYKAFCPKLSKHFALKMIKKNDDDKNQLINVYREYEVMKNSNNPNIEKIIGYFTGYNPSDNKEYYYFILEFIEGKNLDKLANEYQEKKENIDQNLIMKLFFGIENGLYYLHKNGIIHRDISPDNIMLDNNNQVKITDFGLSAYYIKYGQLNNNLVYNYSIVGRKLFVGSEIIQRMNSGDKNILYDIKNDIFAFGVTMYYLMSYGYPICIKNRIEEGKEIQISKINEKIYSKNLIKLVMSMLQNDQNKRPNCTDIYHELLKIKMTNSSFNSVINCLASFKQLYEYLIETQKNVTNIKLQKKEYEFIKIFSGALKDAKIFRNSKSAYINEFINCFYDKILLYDISEFIPPINIIKSIFDYFLTNSPFIYNNKKGYDFSEKTKNNPYRKYNSINNKIQEFVSCYNNILVPTFYFLVLRTLKCQKCGKEITKDLDIKYNLDLLKPDKNKIYKVSELIKDFSQKKIYLNLGINNGYSLTCPFCGIVPKFLDEYKEIILEPEIFILNVISEVKLDKYFEIKADSELRYDLNCVIVYNEKALAYEFAIRNKDDWIYFSIGGSKTMIFEEIANKKGITIAFYCLNKNEFSLFLNKDEIINPPIY